MNPTFVLPLATPADLLVYYDWRWIAENVNDTKPPTVATQAQVLTSTVVIRLIQIGTEKVLAAAMIGGRYQIDDLYKYGGDLIKKITCDLAIGEILKRRGRAAKDFETLALAAAEAEAYLEQLRRGERIFVLVPGVPEAGLPTMPSNYPPVGIGQQPWSWQANRVFGIPNCGPNGWGG